MERFLGLGVDLGATNYRIGGFYLKLKFGSSRTLLTRQKVGDVLTGRTIKVGDSNDARRTIEKVCSELKKVAGKFNGMRNVKVGKCVAVCLPGILDSKTKKIKKETLPNFEDLSNYNIEKLFGKYMGKSWSFVFMNDAYSQGVGIVKRNEKEILSSLNDETLSEFNVLCLCPGTGFGSSLMTVKRTNEGIDCFPLTHLYDLIIRKGKTAEELLSGSAIEKRLGKLIKDVQADDLERFYKDKLLPDLVNLFNIVLNVNNSVISDEKKVMKFSFKREEKPRIVLLSGFLGNQLTKKVILPSLRKEFKRTIFLQYSNLDTVFVSSYLLQKSHVIKEMLEYRAGMEDISKFVLNKINTTEMNGKTVFLFDGYSGIEWKRIMQGISKDFSKDDLEFIDFGDYFLPESEIKDLVKSSMVTKLDKETSHFGKIYEGNIFDIVDKTKIKVLKKKIEDFKKDKKKGIVIVFGCGSSCLCFDGSKYLKGVVDKVFFVDITREEFSKRSKKGKIKPLGQKDFESKTLSPAYISAKRFHYVDFPILDRMKGAIFCSHLVDYYIEDNNITFPSQKRPVLLNMNILERLLEVELIANPFCLKVFYDKGVWGGQQLKKIRKLDLPHLKKNCAWCYELMCYQEGLKYDVGSNSSFEIPFALVLDLFGEKIVGKKFWKSEFFYKYFPTRINYDDCGGDMSIQVHPNAEYMKNFGEPLHQDESYYILSANPKAYVYLGLKEGISIESFRKECVLAEKSGVAFDHRKYVNVWPAKKGDLFLIPAGTIHAGGNGCLILEISATTDRYTFHFYDYMRRDMHGNLRGIHLDHAFSMISKFPKRRTQFVKTNLLSKPHLLTESKGCKIYRLTNDLDYIVFKIFRIEFSRKIELDTSDCSSYHLISLVEGNEVSISNNLGFVYLLKYSESVVIPFSTGKYQITPSSKGKEFKILKTIPAFPKSTKV